MSMDEYIQKIEEQLKLLEERVIALESRLRTTSPISLPVPIPKKKSTKEFLISKNLSSAIEKTLALAYFLEFIEQVTPISIDDLSSAFQSARENKPANLNDMVNKNISKGLLMESKEKKNGKKAWVLTATGEKFIENQASI